VALGNVAISAHHSIVKTGHAVHDTALRAFCHSARTDNAVHSTTFGCIVDALFFYLNALQAAAAWYMTLSSAFIDGRHPVVQTCNIV
jgi:hypothetical protein